MAERPIEALKAAPISQTDQKITREIAQIETKKVARNTTSRQNVAEQLVESPTPIQQASLKIHQ